MNSKVSENEGQSERKRNDCLFEQLGCTFKGGRSKMKNHEAYAFPFHAKLLLEEVTRLERASRACGGVLEDVKRVEASVSELRAAPCTGTHRTLQELSVAVHSSQTHIPSLASKVIALENKLALTCKAFEECDALVKTNTRQLDSNKRSLTDLQEKVKQVDRSIQLFSSVNILPLEVAQNGVFIWRIPQICNRIQEAIDDTMPCLDSEAFYTETYGYKMKVRLYLNGDEQAKGNHLSLYLILLKGDFDSLLQWPFSETIRISVLNHSNLEDSMVHSLVPNHSLLNSFQRPSESGNAAFGVSQFAPLDEFYSRLTQFVHNDTLFVKTEF
ncbi:TNF receptor-associated factor 1 isoform X2 [Amia ocellicauda]|uniref:TNF receptor-associated factor 1 isoform X2 n=1 Tax=Amia ocellicauda TaxID=2972642 RepID=UPI0034638A72